MDDELLAEFVNESREHLATIEADLLAIEEGGASIDDQLINKVFRAAHSVKGGSAFFGLTRIKDLAHKAETVLDMLRSRRMTPNAEITNLLLAAFDQLRDMINQPALRETADTSDLLASLTQLASSYLPNGEKAALTTEVSLPTPSGEAGLRVPQCDLDRARQQGQFVYGADIDLIHDLERRGLNVLQLFREIAETGEILDCRLDLEAVGTLDSVLGNQLALRLAFATVIRPDDIGLLLPIPRESIEVLMDPEQGAATKVAIPPTPEPQRREPVMEARVLTPIPDLTPIREPEIPIATAGDPVVAAVGTRKEGSSAAPASGEGGVSSAGDATLRVQVTLLESLMNLAGELVLSRNQLRSAVVQNDAQALHVADQRLNQVTSDLQDAIMRTRLQPIGQLFGKFPRVVRDLSASLSKEIQLDVRGKDVALDRSILEGLSDPLTHMVRNAVDHGIELPADRRAGGKPAMGTVRIEARHEAGQVLVEIADDGKGIDPDRITQAAVTKGLLTPERAKQLSEAEKLALIFLPGLSTSAKVTDLSGRGVGMDVVKTNLDRLGGQVEIQSVRGRGSTFRIRLPLTLAIIPCLILTVRGQRFALPQVNVAELIRVPARDLGSRLKKAGGVEVLHLRESILPVVRLGELLSEGAPLTEKGPSAMGDLAVAVVTTGTLTYGLVVDAFHDTEEIVVKPLGRHFKNLREYAGATILGDGTVVLILDVPGLAAKAELGMASESSTAAESAHQRSEDMHALLLFQNGPNEVCATPLDSVLRIERIRPEQVENHGGRRSMQYRGCALPLVTLSDAASVGTLADAQDLAVIVSNVRGREVGLLGAMPVDVLETRANLDTTTHRQPGIIGSAILRERTTLIVDVFELVDTVHPEWGGAQAQALGQAPMQAMVSPPCGGEAQGDLPESGPAHGGAVTVLLAEDSDFFRAQMRKYLEQEGYAVLAAPDGEEAWNLLQQHGTEVRAVVTDIEMPRLTGLGLAQRIRAESRYAHLPIVAVTSLAGDEDVARGKEAGITEYQVKLDRDQLLSGLRHLLAAA